MRRCADNGHITRGLIITVVLFLFTFLLSMSVSIFFKKPFIQFLWNFFPVCFPFYSLRRRSHKKQQPNLKKNFPKNAEQNLSRP